MERSRYEVTLFQTIHTGIDTDIAIYKVEAARGRRFWRKFQPWVSKYSKQSRQVQRGKYNKQSRYLKYRRASAENRTDVKKLFSGIPTGAWRLVTNALNAVKANNWYCRGSKIWTTWQICYWKCFSLVQNWQSKVCRFLPNIFKKKITFPWFYHLKMQ